MYAFPFFSRRRGGGAGDIPPGTYATPQDLAEAISQLIGGAPDTTLDTIAEIAARIIDDAETVAAISAAIANKQDANAKLTALSALALAADKLIYATGANTLATTNLTAFARTILAAQDAAGARAAIGAQKGDAILDTVAQMNAAGPVGGGAMALSVPISDPGGNFRQVVVQPIAARLVQFIASMGVGLATALQSLGHNMRETVVGAKTAEQVIGGSQTAYLTWDTEEFAVLAPGDPYRLLTLGNYATYGAGQNSFANTSGKNLLITLSMDGKIASGYANTLRVMRNTSILATFNFATGETPSTLVPMRFVLAPGEVIGIAGVAGTNAQTIRSGFRLILDAVCDKRTVEPA